MAKATLTKNSLIVDYETAEKNSKGEFVRKSVRYNQVKLSSTDESLLEVGIAISSCVNGTNAKILKTEKYILEEEI